MNELLEAVEAKSETEAVINAIKYEIKQKKKEKSKTWQARSILLSKLIN